MAKKTATVKKKVVKVEPIGQAHIHSTFNNVIVTLTNAEGQVISWSSAGKMGFRGSKKNTPYAAQTAAQHQQSSAAPALHRCAPTHCKHCAAHPGLLLEQAMFFNGSNETNH